MNEFAGPGASPRAALATLAALVDPRAFASLADMPPGPRLLARGAFTAAALVSVLTERSGAAPGDEDAVISIGKVGDHLRMLNVLSRMRRPGGRALPAVFANDTAAGLERLFDGISLTVNGGRQGAAFLPAALAARRSAPRYARALAIQPMVQQPLAIAYGNAIAALTIANGTGVVVGVRRLPLDTRSWRTAYQFFLASTFPEASFAATPAVAAHLRWHGDASREIVVHPGGTSHPRGLVPEVLVAFARLVTERGYRTTIAGSRAEGPALRALFGDTAGYAIGEPMEDLARRLASARALVAIDSSLMNLADAVGTPSVIAYTTTDPAACGPFYTRTIAVPDPGMTPLGVDPEIVWSRASEGHGPAIATGGLLSAFLSLVAP